MSDSGKVQPMFKGELAWASNFYMEAAPFAVAGLQGLAASGEHAFNALKTFDPQEQAKVLAASKPGEAKRLGRRVTLRPDWDTGGRVVAMMRTIRGKFTDPALAKKLMETDQLVLVETNTWHDQFWGDCTCARHASAAGTNMLGQLLMATRAQLQEKAGLTHG